MQSGDGHDAALSKDPVFDWGHASWEDKERDEAPAGPSALTKKNAGDRAPRYDPGAMSPIVDFPDADDLMEDGSSDSDDEAVEFGRRTSMEVVGGRTDVENGRRNDGPQGRTKYGPGGKGRSLVCRQTIVILSIIIIIFAASVTIAIAVMGSNLGKASYSVAMDGDELDQQLLETAERVVTACSEHSLDQDRTTCQQMCFSKLCCFQSGKYSCEGDKSKDCAVYAGCEALVEGVPFELDENEDAPFELDEKEDEE